MTCKALYIIIFIMFFALTCVGQDQNWYAPFGKDDIVKEVDGKNVYGRLRYNIYKRTIDGKDLKKEKPFPKVGETICVQIGHLELKYNKKNDKKRKYKLVISERCITSENLKPLIGNYTIYEKDDDTHDGKKYALICFETKKSDKASLKISFDIVKRNSTNLNEWGCDGGFLMDSLTVEGDANGLLPPNEDKGGTTDNIDNHSTTKFNSEQKDEEDGIEYEYERTVIPEPPKDRYLDINKTDIDTLCDYLQTSPTDSRAKNDIKKIDDAKWQIVGQSQNISDYENYLRLIPAGCSYSLIHTKEATNKIEYLRIFAEWNNLKSSKNEEAIIGFYKANIKKAQVAYLIKGEVTLFIKEIFPKINIAVDTIKENDKEKHIIRGKNTVNPKYKDLSLNKGILIDDSNWPDSIVIEIKEAGRYEILIRDEFGRETTLTFDYNFKIDEVNQDRKQYTMEIKGGHPPFTTIISRDGTEISAVKGLKLDKIQLKKDEKISENKIYDIIVRDAGGYKAVSAEKLTIEKSLSVQAIQAIILITALIITLFLLFILLRRKRRRDNPAYAV